MHILKKIARSVIEYVRDEYRFIIFLILLTIILTYPVNYYIITGGGISDVSSRIHVEDGYDSKGSFNISFVQEVAGNVYSYLLSYIIPYWEVESADNYKYNEKEKISDIEFRSDLDLRTANGMATYWAYSLAEKTVSLKNEELYVIGVYSGFDTSLKIKDIILSMDDQHYHSIGEYYEYIETKSKDDTLKIKILRDGEEQVIEAPIFEYEDSLILGVKLQYVREFDTDPKLELKYKNRESGPSGGLISTLEIYNQLTEKDLTKGYQIAGTGTIEVDGSIGQIGGVEHKILGAASAKADIFLVPSGENYEEAIKYKKKKHLKIKIIPVKTIQEAIEKLEKLS